LPSGFEHRRQGTATATTESARGEAGDRSAPALRPQCRDR
jgi:hypothetical protein